MRKEDQPKTPCCNAPFLAVKDYLTAAGQLNLIDHCKCSKCGLKYDINLQPLKEAKKFDSIKTQGTDKQNLILNQAMDLISSAGFIPIQICVFDTETGGTVDITNPDICVKCVSEFNEALANLYASKSEKHKCNRDMPTRKNIN